MSRSITVTELDPQNLHNKLFRVVLYDLFSSEEKQLRAAVYKITESFGCRKLAPVVYTMVRELAVNSLKAVYKKIFFEHVIVEMGLPEVSYEDWLSLFKAEIETHRADNFSRIAREKNSGISVLLKFNEQSLSIRIINEGQPSELELARIQSAIEKCRGMENLHALMESKTENDSQAEGAGMGLPMCIMTLRGLRIAAENFRIYVKSGRTVAELDLPWENLLPPPEKKATTIIHDEQKPEMGAELIEKMDFAILCFDKFENLLQVSENFLRKLNIPKDQVAELHKIIPQRFFKDLFRGVHNINIAQRFENYRVRLNFTENGKQMELLFHVNGYLDTKGVLRTMWQPVVLHDIKARLSEGSILDNLRVQGIIKRYIPQNVMRKALEMTSQGQDQLPNEVVNATALFADIVGFTRLSEKMNPLAVIEVLNLALGMVASTLIRHGGMIDKFMGDAVFAIFDDPLKAVAAGVEIQNLYFELNEMREMQNQSPIEMRIGIHSGQVIMGNVGNQERLDWTAIGDVVNTASRIEQSSAAGQVLISDATYEMVKSQVKLREKLQIQVKGKLELLKVYFVKSVSFNIREKIQTLQIPVPVPV